MIHELADYERSSGSVEVDPPLLQEALFADTPAVFAHVAEQGGEVVGMAIWFLTYSTWTGRHGIYLEDLYVKPEARQTGVGRQLITALAALAEASGYRRIDWSVLTWNETALRFYRSLGAEPMDEWIGYRLTGGPLRRLGRAPAPE